MFPKQGKFVHPNAVYTDVEKTIPSIFETGKKLFFKETEGYGTNKNILNNSVISNQFFHNQLRPVLTVMRVFGVLPIKLPTEEAPAFNKFSAIMAYSVCLYVLTTFITCFNFCYVLSALLAQDQDFFTTIFYTMLMSLLLIAICAPICAWLDLSKLVHYMGMWIEFQMIYLRVTGRPLSLNMKKTCNLGAILCIAPGACAILFHFCPPYIPLWQIPAYYFLLTVINCFITFWVIACEFLSKAGKTLAKNFKGQLRQETCTAEFVGQYRIVWLRLSQLASSLGDATGKTSCFFFAIQVSSMTMCLYGFVSGIIRKNEVLIQIIGMGIAILINVWGYYLVCNTAHKVHLNVKTEMQEQLQLIVPSRINHDVRIEVNAFLNTILSNPPVISVVGFFDVNRGTITSYASALVTYMIVLLQLNMGQSSYLEMNGTQNNNNNAM